VDPYDRAKYYRRVSKRKKAPKELKSHVKKIRTIEEKKRKAWRKMTHFRKKHKNILSKMRYLENQYYHKVDKLDMETLFLGRRDFSISDIPLFVTEHA